MEKTIDICGKQVRFKSSASFLLRYRNYFGAEGLKDLGKTGSIMEEGDLNGVITMLRIIWSLAKNADPRIPPLDDWVDSFDEFPVADIFAELDELIAKSLVTTVSPKNAEREIRDEEN